jgi:DNA repair protein RecN (Recombination protein N)
MLEKLYIKNYALIQELELGFSPNLNIITGETGAGKSIIVDAMMLLLGERASTTYIRQGEKKAVVEGTFWLPHSHPSLEIIKSGGLEISDNLIIIRREITEKSGRAFFNDSPIQVNVLKQFGDLLVDFHGQHDHQMLLNSDTHIQILDVFAKENTLKIQYIKEFNTLKNLLEKLEKAVKKEKEFKEKIDFLNFELKEIKKINPKENEDTEIEAELKIRENAEILYKYSSGINNALDEEDDSINKKLQLIKKDLLRLKDIDQRFDPYIKDLDTSIINLSELSYFTNDYASKIDFDAEAIEKLRERSVELKGLIKKYGSINNALKKKEELEKELNFAENFDYEIIKLRENIINQKSKTASLALKLSEKRKECSTVLEKEVEKKLIDLGIPESVFQVKFNKLKDESRSTDSLNIKINNIYYKLFENGCDIVEFYISTNKGEETKPLAMIASGGEISRVMLAIKNIAADTDRMPMLIFDEIDTGISGKTAQKVGFSMKELSKRHQIISITHLPQICAVADRNILVEKFESNGRTIISAHTLNEKEKLRETARLISGEKITESSLKSASELIE